MPSDLNLGIIFAAVRLKNEFTPEMQKVVAAAQKAGQEMQAAGRVLTLGITAPLVATAAAAIKTSIDFESSFAGVRKTVTATEPQLQALADGFRELALEIPTNVNELNKIGEAAGQLGIQTPNILGFTETMAALGVTTNLASDEAATALARLANITGLQQDEFDNLGSAIVGLGNNFATTEKEIVDFGLRIAGAGELAGLSEGEILGIGTAMSSIGVQAEAGGTAVQKVLNEINQSVATGDEELRVFAEVAGMTAEQFAAAFREDAAGAFESFVTGLGTQGDKSFTVMEDLGFESERVIRAFLGLANAGDLLSDAMDEGNKSFEENVALMIEAEQRYGTTESRLALLWARVRELGITLGDTLVPAVHSFIDVAGPMLTFATDAVKWWSKWPGPLKLASLAVVALVAAIGPALLIGGTLLTSWASIAAVFPVLAAKIGAAALAAQGFWISLAGPVGWAIAALAAVAAAVFHFREELGLVKPSIEDMGLEAARQHVEDLEAQLDGLSSHALRNATRELEKAREGLAELEAAAAAADAAVEKLTKDNFPSFAATLDQAESQLAQARDGLNQMATAGMVVDAEMENWVDGLEAHVIALRDTKTATDAVAEGINALVAKWTGARFNVLEFTASFNKLTDEQLANKTIMGEVLREYDAARAKLGPFNDELEQLWQAEQDATAEAEALTESLELLAEEASEAEAAAKALAKETEALDQKAQAASDAFDRQRDGLLGLPTPQVTADFERLQAVWASIEEPDAATTERYADALRAAADAGIEEAAALLQVIDATDQAEESTGNLDVTLAAAEESTGNLDVTLAALAGQMGGATGQGIALASALMQSNAELDAAQKAGKRLDEEGFSVAQMAAAALGGALQDLGAEIGGVAGKFLQAAGNIATAFATGGPVAAAIAAVIEGIKALGGWIDSMVNGAQMRFNDLTDAIKGSLDAIREGSLTAAEAWDKATNWEGNEEGYEQLRATQELWVEAGLAAEDATDWVERFNQANKNQDTAGLQALLVEYEKIAEQAREFVEWSRVVDDVAASYQSLAKTAEEAGAAAVQAALDAGATLEEATQAGVDARQAAFEAGIALRIEEMAQEAAFQAALFEIKRGNLAGAVAAARAAYNETIEIATAAFDAVAQASSATTEAINTNLSGIDDVEVNVNYNYSNSGDPGPLPPEPGWQPGPGDIFGGHGFAQGSGGRYVDFGRGSNVTLHGKERIVTESEGRQEAASNAASLQGVEDRLDRLDMNLQRAVKRIATDVTNAVMTKSL